jgi:hypothetical protein
VVAVMRSKIFRSRLVFERMFDYARPMGRSGEIRDAVRQFAEGFDPALVDAATAALVVRDWTAIANMAEAVKALAAKRVADSATWRSTGAPSAADWLAKSSGTTTNQAREVLATAGRLDELEATAGAARRGELSPAQTAAISDAATADPGAEERLLGAAKRSSLSELRDDCAKTKAAADPNPDATHDRIRRERRLRRYRHGDGSEHLHAQGTADEMALVDHALAPLIEARFKQARAAGEHEPTEAYAFDALVDLARGAHTAAGATSNPKHTIVLRADWDALIRGWVEGEETCEIAGLGPVPVSVVRRLLGDSILKLVVTKGVDVANVTHLGRGATVAQQIALLWQMPECSREGCPRRVRLQNDHRVPWADIHETALVNLDPLCNPDHDLKTHHGWALVAGIGKRPMVPPDHPDHPRNVALRQRPPPEDERLAG